MGKGPRSRCKVASHHLLKDNAKHRVEDLLSMLTNLQVARKEGRTADVAVVEEQLNQILREWNAELSQPSPASSLREDSFASLSSELARILKPYEEEDDAISSLAEPANFKRGNGVHEVPVVPAAFQEEHHFDHPQLADEFHGFNLTTFTYPDATVNSFDASDLENMLSSWEMTSQLDYFQFATQDEPKNEVFIDPDIVEHGGDAVADISFYLSNKHSSPSAFLGPKCALWDCLRPVIGSEWPNDYCSTFHAHLAMQESPHGLAPILRPGGIGVKDGLLFTALKAKIQGKNVGIPECGGAATAKSPWNAPELFDISILEGETVREWLFFDKPRRAFDSGNRKQRSLPDYSGRGWHESRKQVMKEYGGLKRSYYMDPQPVSNYDWHLFEYEVDNCDGCALYRLEYKLADAKKKSPKAKVINDSLVDLQKRMGRLTADFPTDSKTSGKSKGKGNMQSQPSATLSDSNGTEFHGSSSLPELFQVSI